MKNKAKLGLGVIALGVMCGACGGEAVQTEPPKPVVTTMPSATTQVAPPETDDARTRAFIAKLAAHDFAGAETTFDEKMLAAMPKEKLAEAWSQIEAGAGVFDHVDSVDVKASGEVRIAAAKATFAKTHLILRVVYDARNRVAGFFVAPGDTATAWQPPSYADPTLFDDKRVAIGSSPALPGTLSIPKNLKKYPLVVLVHGSGPNDEDETLGALKPFKDLAFGLASRGIAVLRYDKRTHVDATGVKTQKEEVDDAAHAAIAFARTLPDADPNRIALLGHSQGGYLAPRIAKDDPAIKRLIVLAGPTRPLEDSILAQLTYFATLHPTDDKIKASVEDAKKFKAAIASPTLKATDPVQTPFGSSIPGSYFLEVRAYHPERVAATLTIPMLVLQGEGDYQVTLHDDFPGWQKALAHKKNATLKTYPGLSHAFAAAGATPSPADYEKPGHVDEAVITDIARFLNAP